MASSGVAAISSSSRNAYVMPARLTISLTVYGGDDLAGQRVRRDRPARHRRTVAHLLREVLGELGRERRIVRQHRLQHRRAETGLDVSEQDREFGACQPLAGRQPGTDLRVRRQELELAVEPALLDERVDQPRVDGQHDRRMRRETPRILFWPRLSASTRSATSSVIEASRVRRPGSSRSPVRIRCCSAILMLTSWSLVSTPAELSMASVLIRPPARANSIRPSWVTPRLPPSPTTLTRRSLPVDPDGVVGLVADVGLRLGAGLDVGADAAVPQQVGRGQQDRLDQLGRGEGGDRPPRCPSATRICLADRRSDFADRGNTPPPAEIRAGS